VPGNASGGMEGVAVKPLTVGFHETQFLGKLNGENKLGFWFQLDDRARQRAGEPWGPANPQALNRYSYVLNNPLKYTDPTGHASICGWCNRHLGNISHLPRVVRGSVIAACIILGCRVDYSTGDVYGPTTEDALNGSISGMMPVGMSINVGFRIASGHAFTKHILEKGDLYGLGIRTRKQLANFINGIIGKADAATTRQLSNGRVAFWDPDTGVVVIIDPRSPDLGTVFRPRQGRNYFDNLK